MQPQLLIFPTALLTPAEPSGKETQSKEGDGFQKVVPQTRLWFLEMEVAEPWESASFIAEVDRGGKV